ncbi:hypothetical protein RI054_26g108210 [Pseudoscourfieldia marina]
MGATVMDADLGVPRSRIGSLKVDLSSLKLGTQGNSELKEFKDKSLFLENNVKRLTAELARAQAHARSSSTHSSNAANANTAQQTQSFVDAAGDDAPLPIWITEPAYLSPLLVAYDARVAELEAALARRGGDVKDVRAEVNAVTEENARLNDELKHISSLLAKREQALASASAAAGAAPLSPTSEGGDARVSLLTEENDLLLQQQAALKDELKGLHATLDERTAEAVRLSQELAASAAARRRESSELAAAQGELASLQVRTGAGAPSVQEELANLRARAESAYRDAESARAREGEVRDRYDAAATEVTALRSHVSQHTSEQSRLVADLQAAASARDASKREADDLRDALQATDARLAELQRRDADVYARIKEAMEHAEEARLARERALLSEQKKDAELSRLSEKLVTQRQELEARFEAERSQVRSELESAQDAHHIANKALSEENEALRVAADRARREAAEARGEAEHMRVLLRSGASSAARDADGGGSATSTEAAVAAQSAISEELETIREERDTAHRELGIARMQLERERRQFAAVSEELSSKLATADTARVQADDLHAASVRDADAIRSELTSARLAVERAAEQHAREVSRIKAEHEVALQASLEKVEAARSAQRASAAEATASAEDRARALASMTRTAEECDRRVAELAAESRADADASRQKIAALESDRSTLHGELAALKEEVSVLQKAESSLRPSLEAARRQAELYAKRLNAQVADEEARIRECSNLRDRVDALDAQHRRAERQRDAALEKVSTLQRQELLIR